MSFIDGKPGLKKIEPVLFEYKMGEIQKEKAVNKEKEIKFR